MVSASAGIAITGTTLIDGSGAPPVPGANVLFEDGRVRAAGPAAQHPVPDGYTRIDGANTWLIPGLHDTHVHVGLAGGEEALRHWLAFGVTTVRDLGGDPTVTLDLRERERRGEITGARLVVHGPFLDGVPTIFGGRGDLGAATIVLSNEEEADRAVDRCLEMGVDGFKLYAGLRPDLVRRVVRRVDGRVPVNAHLGRTWASEAAEAGVNCLEHVYASIYQDIARPEDRHGREDGNGANPNYWSWLAGGWSRADLDADYVRRFIDLLVEKRTALTATTDLLGPGGFTNSPRREPHPDQQYAPPAQTKRWAEMEAMMAQARAAANLPEPPAPDLEEGGRAIENQLRFLRLLHEAGGQLLAGTDTGVLRLIPGAALHNELAFLNEAGVDSLTVLHIATGRAAAAMRRDADQGTLTEGKRADAVLLTADPVADIRNTRAIRTVFKDGVAYQPDDLWVR